MAEAADTPKAEAKEKDPTYHVDRLQAESHAFFGVPSHVVAGALSHKGGTKTNLTRAEMESAIRAYKSKTVVTA